MQHDNDDGDDGGDDGEYNDFFDGDDHNDYMMMSITLKVRVRPEDSGKQMICQVEKTNMKTYIYSFLSPSYFGSYKSCSGGDPRC